MAFLGSGISFFPFPFILTSLSLISSRQFGRHEQYDFTLKNYPGPLICNELLIIEGANLVYIISF